MYSILVWYFCCKFVRSIFVTGSIFFVLRKSYLSWDYKEKTESKGILRYKSIPVTTSIKGTSLHKQTNKKIFLQTVSRRINKSGHSRSHRGRGTISIFSMCAYHLKEKQLARKTYLKMSNPKGQHFRKVTKSVKNYFYGHLNHPHRLTFPP